MTDASAPHEEETPITEPHPANWRQNWAPFLSKLALELFVVFVGVTAAFAVDGYRDRREQDERRQAVYTALDRELKQMAETRGPALQRQMTDQLGAWDQARARGERPLPPAFRIPDGERPPTGVWNAAVASGAIELVDPELMFELARFYTRAQSTGDLYQRYSAAAQADVWPHLRDGPAAFWEPDGDLRYEVAAHVQRLRDFRDRQGQLSQEAKLLRNKLNLSSSN